MNTRKVNLDPLLDILRTIKPTAVACSPEVRDWWNTKALPTLRSQALSELHRNDEFAPRIVGFMKGGDMGVVDVSKATGGNWGSTQSKDATAFIHKIAALVPGTYASVFCSEAWALRTKNKGVLDRNVEKYPNLGDHPDRDEVMMFQMLHYDRETNTMMQQSTMIEILKVLGANRSRETWRHTKLSDDVQTTDPIDGSMTGRFVFGDPENPEEN